jgi:hypothetical protein
MPTAMAITVQRSVKRVPAAAVKSVVEPTVKIDNIVF